MVLEKKIFVSVYQYVRGGHLGLVTWTIYINFLPPTQRYEMVVIGLLVADIFMFGSVNGRTHTWTDARTDAGLPGIL